MSGLEPGTAQPIAASASTRLGELRRSGVWDSVIYKENVGKCQAE